MDKTKAEVTIIEKNPFLLNVQYYFSQALRKRIAKEILDNGFLQVSVGEMRVDNPDIKLKEGDIFVDLSGLGRKLISANIKIETDVKLHNEKA